MSEAVIPYGYEEWYYGSFLEGLGFERHHWGFSAEVGDSQVAFMAHLDHYTRMPAPLNLRYFTAYGGKYVINNGSETVLGADDRAGLAILFYMYLNDTPGQYYLFYGEEHGGKGAWEFLETLGDEPPFTLAVEFDRRGTQSLVTDQSGFNLCSRDLSMALLDAYDREDLHLQADLYGTFTDCAVFGFEDRLEIEAVNISAGFENEHTPREVQNLTYLDDLAEASINVNWDSLPRGKKRVYSDMHYPWDDLNDEEEYLLDYIDDALQNISMHDALDALSLLASWDSETVFDALDRIGCWST